MRTQVKNEYTSQGTKCKTYETCAMNSVTSKHILTNESQQYIERDTLFILWNMAIGIKCCNTPRREYVFSSLGLKNPILNCVFDVAVHLLQFFLSIPKYERIPMSNICSNLAGAHAHAQLSSHITFISLEFFEIRWTKCILISWQKVNQQQQNETREKKIDRYITYFHVINGDWVSKSHT